MASHTYVCVCTAILKGMVPLCEGNVVERNINTYDIMLKLMVV